MSFILDALRKSDAKRRSGEPPQIDRGPAPEGPRRRLGSGRRRWVAGVLLLLLVVAGAFGFLERERIGEQIAAWTDRAAPEENAGSPPDETAGAGPAIAQVEGDSPSKVEPSAGTRTDSPSDPTPGIPSTEGRAAEPEDVETALPRERIVSDPDAIERELERLVAAQGAEDSDQESAPNPSRRNRRTLQMPTNIVTAETRDAEQLEREARAREQEALAQMEQRMAAARARREARARAAERAREAARAEALAAETAEQTPESASAPAAAPGADEPGDDAMASDRPQVALATLPAPPGEPDATSESWSPAAPEYLRVWELPLSVRRNLPDLTLNIHVYAEEPRERFVLVNGERFRTGESLADGVRLVEIRREGAILDFRDYRFLLDP